jgi:hypothetical protein
LEKMSIMPDERQESIARKQANIIARRINQRRMQRSAADKRQMRRERALSYLALPMQDNGGKRCCEGAENETGQVGFVDNGIDR